ncbi:hypothetical protein [Amycolatopsis sp. NPDC059657]|uniref:hypothetical protein n=1 Tax=Amycolatopsis sp. NPDC059657 TaxID=3346899 RepID=UPI00366F8ADC
MRPDVTTAYLELARPGGPFAGLMDRVAIPPGIRARDVRGLLSRPLFLAEEKARRAGADMRFLFDLLVSLPDRLFEGDFAAYGRALGLTEAQISLAGRTRVAEPTVFGRGDLYLRGGELKLLEFNLGSSIGGMEWVDINRALLAAPEFARFAEEHELGFHDPLAAIAAELTRHARRETGGERPLVVLTDWPGSYEHHIESFEMLAERLDGPALEVRSCAMGELRASADGVFLHGAKVDLLYRFFGLKEIAGTAGGFELAEPFLLAHEARTTPMFLPFEYSLYSNKRSLAMLSDERNRQVFAADELAVIDRILPWSRPLVPGEVVSPEGRVDLFDYCRARRTGLVLKPSSGFSAGGIVPGWACDERTWLDTLTYAASHSFVVQERVSPDPEPFREPGDDAISDFAVNWGLYVFGDGYAGGMTRGMPSENDPVIGGVAAMIGCLFHHPEAGCPK